MWESILDISAWVLPLVLAITLHEAAHGFAAYLFGDKTAYYAGRMTLNPIRHVDRFGTIVLPGLLFLLKSPFLFGYAKPVPVDFRALKPARLGEIVVAFAGPGTNIFLAFISALLLHLEAFVTPEQAPWLYLNLYRSVMINVVLATFNLLPLLPLDGGRILHALLPGGLARAYARTERFGMLAILLFFMLPALADIPVAEYVIGKPAMMLYNFVASAAGIGVH